MPGFTPREARQFDAYVADEPDPYNPFLCPKQCENPEHHYSLEYCPEVLATELAGRMEELMEHEQIGLWEELHDAMIDGDEKAYALAKVAEGGEAEAEALLRLIAEENHA